MEFLLELTPDPIARDKMIHSGDDYTFRFAENGFKKILALLAYEINDIEKIKDIINKIDNKRIHKDIKIYKENPDKLMKLGRLNY